MFLSMVSAPNEVGAPLSRDTFAQRFNVAIQLADIGSIIVAEDVGMFQKFAPGDALLEVCAGDEKVIFAVAFRAARITGWILLGRSRLFERILG